MANPVPHYPCSKDPLKHAPAAAAVVFVSATEMISHYLCAECARCRGTVCASDCPRCRGNDGSHEFCTNPGTILDPQYNEAWCQACTDRFDSADRPHGPDIVPLDSDRYRKITTRPLAADLQTVSDALNILNRGNTLPGTSWYARSTALTATGEDEGKIARVQLWLLTDAAARAIGFVD